MKNTIEFFLKQPQSPFRLSPRTASIEVEKVLCNDVVLPWESHPHSMRLWVIGNEFGAVCAVWASHEQDALDAMVDEGLGDSFLITDGTDTEDSALLGNAGEPADLDHCWMGEVDWDEKRDVRLLCRFAEARGACLEYLE